MKVALWLEVIGSGLTAIMVAIIKQETLKRLTSNL